MEEYKSGKRKAFVVYIGAPVVIIAFLTGWLLPFFSTEINLKLLWLFVPLSLLVISLMVMAILQTKSMKVIVLENEVQVQSLFRNRTLLFHDIKGFRTDGNYLYLEPFSKGKKRLKISNQIEKFSVLVSWANERFSDLIELKKQEQEYEYFQNNRFGSTFEERAKKLSSAKKVTLILNVIGSAVAFWTFIYPHPYTYVIVLCLLLMVAALLSVHYFKGVIAVAIESSVHPSIILMIILISCAVGYRGLDDFHLDEGSKLWFPVILLALVLFGLLLWGSREFKKIRTAVFLVPILQLFLGMFSMGAIICINCLFDTSTARLYKTKVVSKSVTTGKVDTYNLFLAPWGIKTIVDEIDVPKAQYEQISVNQVTIQHMQGFLGVPWFKIKN